MDARGTSLSERWASVLFDMGGVLVSDTWETILLAPEMGLADRLGLNRDSVQRAGEQLWCRHAVRESSEADYWAELEAMLGISIPRHLVDQCYGLLEVSSAAGNVLHELADMHIQVGVITNNTSFWFERQLGLLPELAAVSDPALWFVSCRHGTIKRDSPGLFGIAAGRLQPETTLVVDDRPANLEIAQRFGFATHEHRMHSDGTLLPRAT